MRPRLLTVAVVLAVTACGPDTRTGPSAEPPFVPFKPTARPFTAVAPLPEPRGYVEAIEIGGFLYAVGGLPPLADGPPFHNATTTVFFTRMRADGSLEPWRETSPLNVRRSSTALVSWTGAGARALYSVGGHADDNRGLDSIERAVIQPDGSLGSWELVAPLPQPFDAGTVARAQDTVVLAGGFFSERVRPDLVFVGTIGPDGFGPWRAAAPLPELSTCGSALAVGNRVHVIVGYDLFQQWTPSTYTGTLDPSGTIATWDRGPSVTSARYHAGLVPDGHGGLLLLGGITREGFAGTPLHSATDPGGNLVGWTPLGALPSPTGGPGAVAAGGGVYVIGGLVGAGREQGPTSDVWRMALDGPAAGLPARESYE